jgi:hypothetical protein
MIPPEFSGRAGVRFNLGAGARFLGIPAGGFTVHRSDPLTRRRSALGAKISR